MLRKIIFGFVWCAVFYFGTCFAIGFVIGFKEGYQHAGDSQSARQAAQAVCQRVISQNLPYIAFGSVTLAVLGSGAGVLPGTRARAGAEY